jgi:hypothetical protein
MCRMVRRLRQMYTRSQEDGRVQRVSLVSAAATASLFENLFSNSLWKSGIILVCGSTSRSSSAAVTAASSYDVQ